jgi:phosphate transport system substrate-binding protein
MDPSPRARNEGHSSDSDALAAIVEKAKISTNASGSALALTDPESGVLTCRARSGSHAPDIGATLEREGTFTGLCVETRQTLCSDDTDKETRLDTQAARALGIRSMMVTPIAHGGNILGALAVFSSTRRAFTVAHRDVLWALANEVAALLAKSSLAPANRVTRPMPVPVAPEPAPTKDATSVRGEAASLPDGRSQGSLEARRPSAGVRIGRIAFAIGTKKFGISPMLVGVLALVAIATGGWALWRSKSLSPAAATPLPAIRLHGSNTLGSEYIPALAKAYLQHIGATEIRVNKPKPEEILIGGISQRGNPVELCIQSHGSWTGFKDLAADKADIAMASTRLPAPESLKGESADTIEKRTALSKLKGLNRAETEFVVGLDGLAIISTASRPTLALSKHQVCDVFGGKITQWSQIAPQFAADPIRVYVRDKNSGTRKTFVDLCFEGKDALPAAGPTVFEDSQQLSNSVAKDPNGIGFVGLPFVHPANSVSVDGRFPDESSVRLEEYAFTRRLYLYRHPHQPGEAELTGEFIEFALSAEGQRVVQQSGFVDQEVRLESPDPPRGAPRDYLALTAGAKRASLALRFEFNSSRLEGKALRDIARLKRILEDNHALNQQIMLLGFSDAWGAATQNCFISKERARAAEDQLHKIGLPNTTVAAFGQLLPLTNEKGADALAKNRRVEIWVAATAPSYQGSTTCP